MEKDCASPEQVPHWSVDQLTVNSQGGFVFGWFFLPGYRLESLVLELRSSTGASVGRVTLDAGRPRQDVANAFPAIPEALESGFLGAGAWSRSPQPDDQLLLRAALDTGDSVQVEIPAATWNASLSSIQGQRRTARYRQWFYYFNKAIALIRQGRLAALGEKIGRHLSAMPQSNLSDSLARGVLRELASDAARSCHFMIDHQLGGGANQYRQQRVSRWLAAGDAVLVLTYNLAKLQPVLTVETGEAQHRFSLDQLSDLPSVLASVSIKTITYNTGVSFLGAEKIPALLLALKRQHQASLSVLIHDYFSVCPSHFLLDKTGHFCAIPDLNTCRECLPCNPHGFSSLFRGDVALWRQLWGPLLQQADEIIAFSNSSVDLLRRAYESWPDGQNWLQGRSIIVKPHTIEHLNFRPFEVQQRNRLVIGVVGRMSFHKGSHVIQDLARHIEAIGGLERICIIGDMEERVNTQIVRQTGVYKRENLGSEIEKAGVNVILFPSICPETFSYVTHEIIQLGLPLACFDYGAPAERVKSYEKGLVLKSSHPGVVLEGLRQLFQTVYLSPPASGS